MYVADLHIHSKYSRATSKDCDLQHLDLWARRKGIHLVGTGDFTHPAWRESLKNELLPAEPGFFRLRDELRLPCETQAESPRFVLSGEISCIYKKAGKTRKVHSVILLPDLDAAERLSLRLEAIGNIRSDGRPILGLDCHDLLEITLEACPDAIFIPAHIWTPHFSLFGAFSGFDAIEECFGDLTNHIHALETGLSSDPAMNYRVSALDGYQLVSNSDAHSPAKLAREANLLEIDLSYSALRQALNTGEGLYGTLEFFPEEGKYHLDGHRGCDLCLEPEETKRFKGICPVCGRKITIGVLNRVEALADRANGIPAPNAKPYECLIPLPEIIAASLNCGSESRKAQALYFEMLAKLGPELDILRRVSEADIQSCAGLAVAEGIRRLRADKVQLKGGYDGEYGKIALFQPGELEALAGQMMMAGLPGAAPRKKRAVKPAAPVFVEEVPLANAAGGLNAEQLSAVMAEAPAVAVIAGPGTGKTMTLVERIAHLIESGAAKPSEITAVTFTNQAAAEMRVRLEARLGGKKALRGMTIGTFHAICLGLLDKKPLVNESEILEILRALPGAPGTQAELRRAAELISRFKNGLDAEAPALLESYQAALQAFNARDLDDLLLDALQLDLHGKPMFRHLLVDEYQDINAIQRQLVLHFSAGGRTLFVIGDPDQSIYGFRGADAGCFEELRRALPDLKIIALRQNYRSTPEILQAACTVIAHNPGGARALTPNRPSGLAVRSILAETSFDEGVFIAKEIARMTGGMDMLDAHASIEDHARSFSDFAVLCRTRRQLGQIENCLRHDDIPCVICGREDYLNDDGVRGALAFFQSLYSPGDAAALKLCLRLAFDCDEAEIAQAEAICSEHADPSVWPQAAGFTGHLGAWAACVTRFLPILSKGKPRKLLEEWEALKGSGPAMALLKDAALFSADMPELLNLVLLGQEADIRRAAGKGYASGAVRLMTLHAAKGLEFPVVFLAGVGAGALPLERKDTPTDIQEERRLFFVGITRARESLIITVPGEPSAFIGELPQDIVPARLPRTRKQLQGQQLSFL